MNEIMDVIMTNITPSLDNSTDLDYLPYAKRIETYLVPILFSIIFFSGILGNWTVCVIFIKHPSMRNVPNTYIFSLAFGDLVLIFVSVPLAGLIYVYDTWPWSGELGENLCRIFEFTKDISTGVSIFTLVALAFDRYMGICNPLKKLQARSRMVHIIIAFTWLLAICFALPAVVVSRIIRIHDFAYCNPYGHNGRNYACYTTAAKATVFYFFPLTIIGILYSLIARKLHNSAKEVQNIVAARGKSPQAQNRRHVARMVVVFILVFIICFLPHWTFALWFWCNDDAEVNYNGAWHTLRIVAFCLYFLNSTINPLALYFVSSLFRKHFQNYLCCRSNSIEIAPSVSRGQSHYKASHDKHPMNFVETTNYTTNLD